MMLCALSSLCHAQKIRLEYDEAGNLVKRYVPQDVVKTASAGDTYAVKITLSSNGEKMNIKFYEGRSGNIVDCRIQVMIHPLTGSGTVPFSQTYTEGNIDINTAAIPKSNYAVVVLAFVNPSGAPVQATLKFEN